MVPDTDLRRWRAMVWMAAILVVAVVVRLPQLINADALFDADEAVNALAAKRLLTGQDLRLAPWDASYYGVLEGILAGPYVLLFGWSALAFKLAALSGHLALLVALFLLGRRLIDRKGGLVAAALAAAFSPAVIHWSTKATGGSSLVTAWAAFTILQLARVLDRPSAMNCLTLGLLAGLGLYHYSYFVLYLAVIGAWTAVVLLLRWRTPPRLRVDPRAAVAIAIGFAMGLLPKLLTAWLYGSGSKGPSLQLGRLAELPMNARRLATEVVPAFFGVDPFAMTTLGGAGTGSDHGARLIGGALLPAYLALVGTAVWMAGGEIGRWRRHESARPPLLGLLILLLVATFTALLVSRGVMGPLATRFLLPCLVAIPILVAAGLAALGQLSEKLSRAVLTFLLAVPLVQIATWNVHLGLLAPTFQIVHHEAPVTAVLRYLRERRIPGAYSSYWSAYPATFLSGERILVAPHGDWDRYPLYTRKVDRLDQVAYFFRVARDGRPASRADAEQPVRAAFLKRLESVDRPYVVARVGDFEVYHGRRNERLLPPSVPDPPEPLRSPRAEITLVEPAPAAVGTGELFDLRLRVVNHSDGAWSSSGLPLQAGALRVSAAYRWLRADGTSLSGEPERVLLPGDVPVAGDILLRLRVAAPSVGGHYTLRITLVQETVAWFDATVPPSALSISLEVG